MENYVAQHGARCNGKSVANLKLFLKTFYKALLAPESRGHPDIVSWISIGRYESRDRKPSDLLTRDEVLKLATATTNPRDRAFIMVIYESAARVGEMINLRVGDVKIDQYGARLTLRGKTGERVVRIIRSAKDLQTWLEDHHPLRDKPDAPVFFSWGSQNRHGALLHDGIRRMMANARKAAGIKKRVHPHLFRHSRLTELAKELKEAELNVFAGWAGDSKMARVYVHLSSDDVEKKLLQNAGILRSETGREADPLAPMLCLRCRAFNSATARHCHRCGIPLDEKELVNMADLQDKLIRNLPKLLIPIPVQV